MRKTHFVVIFLTEYSPRLDLYQLERWILGLGEITFVLTAKWRRICHRFHIPQGWTWQNSFPEVPWWLTVHSCCQGDDISVWRLMTSSFWPSPLCRWHQQLLLFGGSWKSMFCKLLHHLSPLGAQWREHGSAHGKYHLLYILTGINIYKKRILLLGNIPLIFAQNYYFMIIIVW